MEACFPQSQAPSPKRKRGQQTTVSFSPPQLSFPFDPAITSPVHSHGPDDGHASHIASSIVHSFNSLMLEGGLSGSGAPAEHLDLVADAAASKRQKQCDVVMQVQHAMWPQTQDAPHEHHHPHHHQQPQLGLQFDPTSPIPCTSGTLQSTQAQQSFPSQSSPSSPDYGPRRVSPPVCARPSGVKKNKSRRRAGTPPLRSKRANRPPGARHDEADPVEPIRASLTWREDEITVYDPNDRDDDGTGVNGIGFKPSAALAQARVMKRRQQLADYRRREEDDARAQRNQRRRGDFMPPRRDSRSQVRRRVRFTDVEGMNIAVKTG